MGRRVQNSYGWDSRKMFMTARNRYGADIDLANRFKYYCHDKEVERGEAPLLSASVFRNSGQIENDGQVDKYMYFNVKDDCIEDNDNELESRMSGAVR